MNQEAGHREGPSRAGPARSIVQTTLSRLNDNLQGPSRPQNPERSAIANTAQATRRVLETNEVTRMVRAPWRIARAVYPWLPAHWPVGGKPAADVLADCRTYIEREEARASHWSHDPNRLIALRQAEAALALLVKVERGGHPTE